MREPDITFTLPFTTRSKKNEKIPRKGGKGMVYAKKDSDQKKAIIALLIERLQRMPGNPVIPKDTNVAVEIVRHLGKTKADDCMEVRIWKLAQRESPRGWDIDVGNYSETILDAMQGLIFHDDVQVSHLTCYRKKS